MMLIAINDQDRVPIDTGQKVFEHRRERPVVRDRFVPRWATVTTWMSGIVAINATACSPISRRNARLVLIAASATIEGRPRPCKNLDA